MMAAHLRERLKERRRGYSTPHHMAVAALAKARGEDRDA